MLCLFAAYHVIKSLIIDLGECPMHGSQVSGRVVGFGEGIHRHRACHPRLCWTRQPISAAQSPAPNSGLHPAIAYSQAQIRLGWPLIPTGIEIPVHLTDARVQCPCRLTTVQSVYVSKENSSKLSFELSYASKVQIHLITHDWLMVVYSPYRLSSISP